MLFKLINISVVDNFDWQIIINKLIFVVPATFLASIPG